MLGLPRKREKRRKVSLSYTIHLLGNEIRKRKKRREKGKDVRLLLKNKGWPQRLSSDCVFAEKKKRER